MYRVTKEIRFCYGHRLLDYRGPCEHLHGHNGLLEITFATEELDERGMVLDFTEIKRFVKTWVDETLDHKMLLGRNDPLLQTLVDAGEPVHVFDASPTAENIARAVFLHTKESGYPVERVRLWETDTSWAEFGDSLRIPPRS